MKTRLLHLLVVLSIMVSLFGTALPAVAADKARQLTPPTVTTDDATSITSNSATLNGSLTSPGTATNLQVSFEWGLTAGSYTEMTTPVSTAEAGPFSFTLTGLSPGTTYHFRAKAVGHGSSYGADKTFTTLTTPPPAVTTNNATGIGAGSAILNGTLTSKGTAENVTVCFEWGLTSAYGNSTTPLSTNATGPFSAPIAGLSLNTTYHFRAKAVGHGTSYGLDKTFTTVPGTPPAVATDNAGSITINSAVLNGTLTSKGTADNVTVDNVTVSFQWGLSENYTNETPPVSTNATGPFSAAITGLSCNTTYHFRAKAVGAGTSYGADKTFTTLTDAPIFLDPPVSAVGIGLVFNLAMKTNVTASQPVSGVQAFINYDPRYLEVVDADNSTAGIQIIPGAALPEVLLNSANVTAGTIDFSAGKLYEPGKPFPTGTFTVATIQFRALALTDNTTTCVTFSFTGTRRTKVDYGGDTLTGTHSDGTIQIFSSATVNISVVLKGGSRPDPGWIIPVTVKFFTPGADVLWDTPLYTCNFTATKSGSTATGNCTDIQPATYGITIVSEHTLRNVKWNVVITAPSTAVDMGTLLEGNANNDSVINISDFGILAVSFMKSTGQPGFDARADFDRNGIIDISDFGLLAVNFMRTSPVTVP